MRKALLIIGQTITIKNSMRGYSKLWLKGDRKLKTTFYYDLFLTFCIDHIGPFLFVPNVCKPFRSRDRPDPCCAVGSMSRTRCSCCANEMTDQNLAFESRNRYICDIAKK
jgi:hypothetical protein